VFAGQVRDNIPVPAHATLWRWRPADGQLDLSEGWETPRKSRGYALAEVSPKREHGPTGNRAPFTLVYLQTH